MKTFLFFLVFSIFFIGCSSKNGFSRFNLSHEQELGADSILSSKVKKGNEVNGIVSVVYLNKIYPDVFKEKEVFYVYYYLKKSQKISYTLNQQKATYITELNENNEFATLTSIKTKWSKYYLVEFKKQGDRLKFKFNNGDFSSDTLVFEKDE